MNTSQGAEPETWQEFTTKFVSRSHSFTGVEIEGKRAQFRQLDDAGQVVDSFAIAK